MPHALYFARAPCAEPPLAC